LRYNLLNEWDMMREQNPAKKPSFDAIVANPFSFRCDPTDALGDDVRFKSHGLAPKSAADFASLLHGFHYLKDEGVMAIILQHGVLFRGGAEERIRTKLLKVGHIDIDALAIGESVDLQHQFPGVHGRTGPSFSLHAVEQLTQRDRLDFIEVQFPERTNQDAVVDRTPQ